MPRIVVLPVFDPDVYYSTVGLPYTFQAVLIDSPLLTQDLDISVDGVDIDALPTVTIRAGSYSVPLRVQITGPIALQVARFSLTGGSLEPAQRARINLGFLPSFRR